ncbi:unnamed protein product, partial [Medioppia subpectinata]
KCNCFETSVGCVNKNLDRVPIIAAETTSLDVRHNRIQSLRSGPFRHLSLLTKLFLNNNQISELEDLLFAGLARLVYLNLSNNQIKTIGKNSFKNLHNLEILSLNDNKIEIISELVLTDLPSLKKMSVYLQCISLINIENNNLICNCNLLWLKRFSTRIHEFEATCHSPQKLKNKKFFQISLDEFECNSTQISTDLKPMRNDLILNERQNLVELSQNLNDRELVKTKILKPFGSDLSLHCSDYENIFWIKNESKIQFPNQSNRLNIGNNGSLLINKLLPTDSGIYKCVNEFNKIYKIYSIDVLVTSNQINTIYTLLYSYTVPPVFVETPESVIETQTGDTIKLKCFATGFPEPSIIWTRRHKTNFKVNNNELKIKDIKPTDEDIYECMANNSLGVAVKEVNVKVRGGSNQLIDTHLESHDILEAFQEAKEIVDQAINQTLHTIRDKKYRLENPSKLRSIARFPLSPESIEFAKSIEMYEKTLEIIRRKAEEKTKLPTIQFKYADLLSPNQLNILAHLSGCLVGHRFHNSYQTNRCREECTHQTYRSYDGVCNNLENQLWGASLTPFRRLIDPQYEDGIHLPIGWFADKKYNGFAKPNARKVSQQLLSAKKVSEDVKHSHMLMQFGQFLDHDIDFAMPSVSFNAFNRELLDCSKTCSPIHPCFSIQIPIDDIRRNVTKKRHTFNQNCIELIRSSASCGSGLTSVAMGTLMPREQVNQLTSFIDGSNVYGSTSSLANELRDKIGRDVGLMRSKIINGKQYLPQNEARLPNDCQQDPKRSDFDCFLAGDFRANEQLGLLTMHTLWLREHNRIAKQLSALNSVWSGEQVYQESRKIVGSQLQVSLLITIYIIFNYNYFITFYHWLPHILGPNGMSKLGEYKGYDNKVNPSVANVFATAALRFGHTLINPFL